MTDKARKRAAGLIFVVSLTGLLLLLIGSLIATIFAVGIPVVGAVISFCLMAEISITFYSLRYAPSVLLLSPLSFFVVLNPLTISLSILSVAVALTSIFWVHYHITHPDFKKLYDTRTREYFYVDKKYYEGTEYYTCMVNVFDKNAEQEDCKLGLAESFEKILKWINSFIELGRVLILN